MYRRECGLIRRTRREPDVGSKRLIHMGHHRAVLIAASILALAACGSATGGEAAVPITDDIVGGEVEGVSLRLGELSERTIDIDADGRNTTAAVAAMNAFAVDLYRAIDATDETDDNVVISPYSVTTALAMIEAGAAGGTASEMADVLHTDIDLADWQEGLNAYDLTLDARTAGSPTTWAAANKVWAQPGLALRPGYLDVLTGTFGSPLAEGDFAADPDVQRSAINRWVAAATSDHIPELFPQGAIRSDTRMVLVNAVALDAPWEFPFDPAGTMRGPFTLSDGSFVGVEMMHYDEFLPTAATENYQAVELPYGGGALSMVIIVPTDLEAFEADLSVDALDAVLGSITDGGVHLTMPRWSTRTELTLNDTLADLGMPTAFTPNADFTGMVDGGGLVLDLVQHQAFIEVDEDGTRAAAATGGAMAASHGPTINVDRPFFYVIRDRGSGALLFMGRVLDPTIPA